MPHTSCAKMDDPEAARKMRGQLGGLVTSMAQILRSLPRVPLVDDFIDEKTGKWRDVKWLKKAWMSPIPKSKFDGPSLENLQINSF